MRQMNELIGQDLSTLFSVDWNQCSIGKPSGPGLKLGYEGWSNLDIALDPALPLDMCVDQLGLHEKFDRIECNYFLNYIHGDCTLTHAGIGIKKMLKKNGTLLFTALDTVKLAKDAIYHIENSEYTKGQILEKFLFRPAIDDSGIVFQQNLMTPERAKLIMGFQSEEKKIAVASQQIIPDHIRLEGISEATWEIGAESNSLTDGLSHDWPKCIRCGRLCTKMDENRTFYSRYCKNHYAEARTKCDEAIVEAYSFVIEFRRNF